MRKIDADKLCTDLMERWEIADKRKEELVRQVMADIVTPIVVSQPTVEPERKRGKWIRITQGAIPEIYMCPFCNRTLKDSCIDGLVQIRYPFCHCGADMRGDENDQSK